MEILGTVAQVFWHVANFVAPAFGMACLLSLIVWWRRARSDNASFVRVWITLFGLGVGVGLLGLALMGLDGAMATYAALVVVTGCASAWFDRSGC